MTQYQSFPDSPGGSRTLDKLKALSLPVLAGQSFLDVGCNEGFFSGFAKAQGATRSVGIDSSRTFIERARERFPDCEFHCRSWDELPKGDFDVILLASALHYAENQAALIHSLMEKLSRHGTLVLEIGVGDSERAEWCRVTRGIDVRYFPSRPMLDEILADYAWKWMGPSINQDGDPVNRHVIHVSKKRPLVCLLLQPPGYGKSTIARTLFATSGMQVISGDALLASIARGEQPATDAFSAVVAQDFSPFSLDATIRRVFEQGHGDEFVLACIEKAAGSDFALDMFVPQDWHAFVEAAFLSGGYLPVRLVWERPGPLLPPPEVAMREADAFYLSLAGDSQGAAPLEEGTLPWGLQGCGYLDDVLLQGDQLILRGWAIDSGGELPMQLQVELGGRRTTVSDFERQIRHDVQATLGTAHALLGYRIIVDTRGISRRAIAKTLRVRIPGGAVLATGMPVDQLLTASQDG